MIIGLVNKISPVVPCKISAVVPSRSIANKKRSVAVKKVKISKKKQLEKNADAWKFNFTAAEVEEWAEATLELRRAVDEQFSMAMRSITSVHTPNPIVIRNLQAWNRRPRCIHQEACVIHPIRPSTACPRSLADALAHPSEHPLAHPSWRSRTMLQGLQDSTPIRVNTIGPHLLSIGAHLQENRRADLRRARSLSVSPCRKNGLDKWLSISPFNVKQSLVKQLLKLGDSLPVTSGRVAECPSAT